jgi:MFS family permease
MIGAVFGLAFLLGPVLGGLLLQASWHWLFLINLPLAAIVLWQSVKHIPDTTRSAAQPLDKLGVLLLAACLGLFTLGISRIDLTDPLGTALAPGQGLLALVGLMLAPLFWRVERRAVDPLVRPGLFASRQVVLTSAFALGAGLTEGALVFLPALAVAAMGVTESVASFMLLPIVLTLAVGAPLAGRLLDRIGSRIVVQAGLALTAAGLLLFRADVSSLIIFYSAGALVGFGLSALLGAPLRYILLNEVSAADRGSAQGVLTVFTSIGQLLGGALVGAIAAASGGGALGYQQSLMALGVITALLLISAGGLKSRAAEGVGRQA